MPEARSSGSHLGMFIRARPNAPGAAVVAVDVRRRMPSPASQRRQCLWRPMTSVNGSCDEEGATFQGATSTTNDYTMVPSRQSFLANQQRVEQAVARLRVGVGFECHGRRVSEVLSCEPHHERFTVQPTRAVAGWRTGLFPRPFRWPHRVPGWIHKPPARHASAGISGQA